MTVLCLKCYWYDVDETPSENETCETRKWCLKFAVSYDYENDYFDQTGVEAKIKVLKVSGWCDDDPFGKR